MLPRLLAPGLLFLASLAAGGSPLAARELFIQRFHADILVAADGSITVTENITVRFVGSWNGIFRNIPVQYTIGPGLNYTYFLDLKGITDDAGAPLEYESKRERHYRVLKIWVPGAADATRTVVIRYRVKNGLRFFDTHDELYWNITGDEWEMPIEAASATITLPPGVTGVRAVAYTGPYGSREQAAEIQLTERDVHVRATRPFGFREGLTVAVGWAPGVVRRPTLAARTGLFFYANWAFVLPLLAFGLMLRRWYVRGRDPRLRPIAAQYEPPDQLTPAELGALIDESADPRDITATIVDLAVRGYLTIQDTGDDDYELRRARPEAEWNELQPHERQLLEGLFRHGAGSSVRVSDLKDEFYKELSGIRDRIYDRLTARGYYQKRPDRVRTRYIALALVVGVLAAVAGGTLSSKLGQLPWSALMAAGITALIIGVIGWNMPAKTAKGARALEGVLGFEEFLSRVEKDRMQRLELTPELFEKYLPYAMALRVERKWARAFETICREPPRWYQGTHFGTFSTGGFVRDLGSMSSTTASAMTSSPRSAGGSGFGGGGGSGGGGGGGGGGGF